MVELSNPNDLVNRHDMKNALLCTRRVAELLPELGDLDPSDLKTLSDELMKAAELLENAIARLSGGRM